MTSSRGGEAFGVLNVATWESFYTTFSAFGSTYLLGAAMAGVGLSTNLKMFKGLGLKPFMIGLVAAFSVSIMSLILISLFGDFVTI